LVEDDYLQVVIPEINRAIAEHGKINVFVMFEDFQGWTPKAAKEDLKLLSKIEHFDKMAIIGEEELNRELKGMFEFLGSLLPAVSVKFFDYQNLNQALDWLRKKQI
jgi:hypothetical protein